MLVIYLEIKRFEEVYVHFLSLLIRWASGNLRRSAYIYTGAIKGVLKLVTNAQSFDDKLKESGRPFQILFSCLKTNHLRLITVVSHLRNLLSIFQVHLKNGDIQSYYMTSSVSGQDEPNLVL